MERTQSLRMYAETAKPIDAIVTMELLVSIFRPGGPLHDGAVIIREGLLVAAGCTLPLTASPKVDATVHTRHKAALGMSEESDAIVVVISEESGTMSIASNGRMIGNLDEERMRRVLSSLLRSRIQPLPFRSTKAS